jgi:ABC-2 type transport system ATP-binding protein
MFADDLVVLGGGRLLAAESVASITARSGITVIVQTPHQAELIRLLAERDIPCEVTDGRVRVHGTTRATVSQLAYDHHVQVVELSETSVSLEDTLLDLTSASAEFASA